MIGLREFRKEYKKAKLTYKIKSLRWDLLYAWQRAWRGYDDTEVFELSYKFTERMIHILKDFRKNNIALFPNIEYKDTVNYTDISLTEEETNSIIDEMIYHFENSDMDAWTEKTDLTPSHEGDMENINEFEENAMEHEKQALAMFVKWFDCLWY